MKTIIQYYFLSVLFTVLFATIFAAFIVFAMGYHDPKFGQSGTVWAAMDISGACTVVSSFGSACWFYRISKRNGDITYFKIFIQGMLNGLIVSISYMPVIVFAPIIDGYRDWPQYIVYFLVLGVIVSMLSNGISNLINWPNESCKQET
jgi:hypothetical protein